MRPYIRTFAFSLLLVSALFVLGACGDDDDSGTKPKPATYTLYFSQDNNANGLHSIDTDTGVATIVGDGITQVSGSTCGLAYRSADGGILLGSKWSLLMEINLDGSGSVDVGGIGNEALAYDDKAGILYGCLNGDFRSIDTATGEQAAALTGPGGDAEGLAVEYSTGNVFGLISGDPATLTMYDATADTWTAIGPTGLDMDSVGLAYSPATKELYAVNDDGNIYTLDQTTGAATLVGAHGLASSNGGGLAFAKD